VIEENAAVQHDVSPNTTKHSRCLHGLNDLVQDFEPYWIKAHGKDGLFSWRWFNQAKGCVVCNRMYVAMEDKGTSLPKMCDELKMLWPRLDAGLLGESYHEEVKLAKQGMSMTEEMMRE
jgi:hypothetical protein